MQIQKNVICLRETVFLVSFFKQLYKLSHSNSKGVFLNTFAISHLPMRTGDNRNHFHVLHQISFHRCHLSTQLFSQNLIKIVTNSFWQFECLDVKAGWKLISNKLKLWCFQNFSAIEEGKDSVRNADAKSLASLLQSWWSRIVAVYNIPQTSTQPLLVYCDQWSSSMCYCASETARNIW